MVESRLVSNKFRSGSLIELSQYTESELGSLFEQSLQLKYNHQKNTFSEKLLLSGEVGVLLFFEPSTRTRFSFETACARAGVHPLVLSGAQGTSLEKGETMEDTIFNLEALKPLFFVIRASDDLNFHEIDQQLSVPLINAGWGQRGHPTQALLDAMTLYEKWGQLRNKQILFVGDIKHSRVVRSHLELAKILGYKIGYCSPDYFLPSDRQDDVQFFSQLKSGLEWADAVVALRVQKERHLSDGHHFSVDSYRAEFGLNAYQLKALNPKGLILHPGPINYGIELEKEILKDARSVIMDLVTHGAFLRESLIRRAIQLRQSKGTHE